MKFEDFKLHNPPDVKVRDLGAVDMTDEWPLNDLINRLKEIRDDHRVIGPLGYEETGIYAYYDDSFQNIELIQRFRETDVHYKAHIYEDWLKEEDRLEALMKARTAKLDELDQKIVDRELEMLATLANKYGKVLT